jgi:hypothetical protein
LKRGTLFNNYFGSFSFDSEDVYESAVARCPYMFASANIINLEVHDQIDTYLITNLFRFQNNNASLSFQSSINSTINSMTLMNCFHFKLDESFLNYLVFEQIQELDVWGSIASIKFDLFKPFLNLNVIKIMEFSLTNFFHKVGVSWTAHLNSKNIMKFITFTNFDMWDNQPEW